MNTNAINEYILISIFDQNVYPVLGFTRDTCASRHLNQLIFFKFKLILILLITLHFFLLPKLKSIYILLFNF